METLLLLGLVGGFVYLWKRDSELKAIKRERADKRLLFDIFIAALKRAEEMFEQSGNEDRFADFLVSIDRWKIFQAFHQFGWIEGGASSFGLTTDSEVREEIAAYLVGQFHEYEFANEEHSYFSYDDSEDDELDEEKARIRANEKNSWRKENFANLVRHTVAPRLLKRAQAEELVSEFLLWEKNQNTRLEDVWAHYKNKAIKNKGDNSAYLAGRDLVRRFLSERRPTAGNEDPAIHR